MLDVNKKLNKIKIRTGTANKWKKVSYNKCVLCFNVLVYVYLYILRLI